MICPYCATTLPNNAEFCNGCGKKLPQSDQTSDLQSQSNESMHAAMPMEAEKPSPAPRATDLPQSADEEVTLRAIDLPRPTVELQPSENAAGTASLPQETAAVPAAQSPSPDAQPAQPFPPVPSSPQWPPTVAGGQPPAGAPPQWAPTVLGGPPVGTSPQWIPTLIVPAGQPPAGFSPQWTPTLPAAQPLAGVPPQWPPTVAGGPPVASSPQWTPVVPNQPSQPMGVMSPMSGVWPAALPAGQPVPAPYWQPGMPTGPIPGQMTGPVPQAGTYPAYQVPGTYPAYPGPGTYPALTVPPATQAQPVFTEPPPPPGPFQRWMLRTFQNSLPGNALFGILLGGVSALALGVLSSLLLVSILHAIAPGFPETSFRASVYHPSGQDLLTYALGATPLHDTWRDSLYLFLLMHGVGQHISYVTNGNATTIDFNATLNGFLILPALLLTLGGYVAASTDLRNRTSSSLLRGAAIAIPYALLLLLLMTMVNGSLPFASGEPATDINTLTLNTGSLLLFGLLWGTLFGLLGASLKLGRGHWRAMLARSLSFTRYPLTTGMIVGALTSAGLGLALSLLTVFCLAAFSALSVPLYLSISCGSYNFADWQLLGSWVLTQGPLHAANLFFYSFNAPVTIHNPKELYQAGCFYTSKPQVTLSMFGGDPHLPAWTYLLLLIPLISLLWGGKISARIGRARDISQGLFQGALIAVPFTILMMLLSVITMVIVQWTGNFGATGGGFGISTFTQSFGVGAFDLLLWALLSSALLGALGGAYQVGAFRARSARAAARLRPALCWPGMLGAGLIERMRGQPRTTPRTSATLLLYSALVTALLLALAVALLSIALISFNQNLTYVFTTRVRDILSVLMVALPGLLLLAAIVAALTEERLTDAPAPLQYASVPTAGPLPPSATGPFPPSYNAPYSGGL